MKTTTGEDNCALTNEIASTLAFVSPSVRKTYIVTLSWSFLFSNARKKPSFFNAKIGRVRL